MRSKGLVLARRANTVAGRAGSLILRRALDVVDDKSVNGKLDRN